MNVVCCTSWSYQGYVQYGKRFLASYLKHCPWPLVVYYEGYEPDEPGPTYVNLLKDEECCDFLLRHRSDSKANGVVSRRDGKLVIDYRFQAVKWARKVFALTSPSRPPCDLWVWFDADVEFTRKPPKDFFRKNCPEGVVATYLGRKDWHHSECGFVAYNMNCGAEAFLEEFRDMYRTDAVFEQKEWHDSFVFDVLRRDWEARGHAFRNLSDGVEGMHVWPKTPLGKFSTHNKGVIAKQAAYGDS